VAEIFPLVVERFDSWTVTQMADGFDSVLKNGAITVIKTVINWQLENRGNAKSLAGNHLWVSDSGDNGAQTGDHDRYQVRFQPR
jgi:hypothetical protein